MLNIEDCMIYLSVIFLAVSGKTTSLTAVNIKLVPCDRPAKITKTFENMPEPLIGKVNWSLINYSSQSWNEHISYWICNCTIFGSVLYTIMYNPHPFSSPQNIEKKNEWNKIK